MSDEPEMGIRDEILRIDGEWWKSIYADCRWKFLVRLLMKLSTKKEHNILQDGQNVFQSRRERYGRRQRKKYEKK